MKISRIWLENFRGYCGREEILFENFNVIIGRNDNGKSSILEAIDLFIKEGKGEVKLDGNDLNVNANNEGIQNFKIGIEFIDFPQKIIIDETNHTSLNDEYLLNNEGKLEIWKIFERGKIKTYIKCNHPANDEFLEKLLTKKIDELKKFVETNNINVSDKRKASELRKAIRDYYENKEKELKKKEIEIPIDAEGLKDIWAKLKNYMPIYALFHSDRKNLDEDREIQDPLKIKIEEIFKREEVKNKLKEIGEEINEEIKQYSDSVIKQFKSLSNLNTFIEANIPSPEELKWQTVYKSIEFITEENIPLNKRGSGIRRLILLSSLLTNIENNNNNKNEAYIIYAIEEPETALHPDLQIKVINSLIELSKKDNYQIIITTHSPALLRFFETKHIRYVEKENNVCKVHSFDENIANKIINAMGLIHYIGKVVICLEGTTDETFLKNINSNIEDLKNIINLEEYIESGLISIIPMHGSNLKDWINRHILKNSNVLEFHLYDKDKDEKYKEDIKKINNRGDGSKARLTKKREIENYVPKEIIEEQFKMEISLSQDEDWDDIDVVKKISEQRKDLKEGHIKSIICGKCSKSITKEHLEQMGAWKEVVEWFNDIKELLNKAIGIKNG